VEEEQIRSKRDVGDARVPEPPQPVTQPPNEPARKPNDPSGEELTQPDDTLGG
jgi:hypothetical protein